MCVRMPQCPRVVCRKLCEHGLWQLLCVRMLHYGRGLHAGGVVCNALVCSCGRDSLIFECAVAQAVPRLPMLCLCECFRAIEGLCADTR